MVLHALVFSTLAFDGVLLPCKILFFGVQYDMTIIHIKYICLYSIQTACPMCSKLHVWPDPCGLCDID